MATVKDLAKRFAADDLESLGLAIEAYDSDLWSREVRLERVPLDALVFAEWQQPYKTLDEYVEQRCRFDPETNEWLQHYVREMSKASFLPPVLLVVTNDGVALIDGAHRTSALLMFTERTHIDAWVIQ